MKNQKIQKTKQRNKKAHKKIINTLLFNTLNKIRIYYFNVLFGLIYIYMC